MGVESLQGCPTYLRQFAACLHIPSPIGHEDDDEDDDDNGEEHDEYDGEEDLSSLRPLIFFKSLVPTFAFTPSTQLLHVPTYHKARMALVYFQSSHGPSIFSKLAWPLYIFKAHMALVYFQSSHGPHKIQSDKELDIQVWLTPPSFS